MGKIRMEVCPLYDLGQDYYTENVEEEILREHPPCITKTGAYRECPIYKESPRRGKRGSQPHRRSLARRILKLIGEFGYLVTEDTELEVQLLTGGLETKDLRLIFTDPCQSTVNSQRPH